ncbi:UDP-3-O-acyl-N-acetylglucosamine deacetylase [Marinithermus hydrothermalis]|uniref:UDP-3-O-acyl-N-acetylglucosamine deacetylase n=1 Tax=Marinithermus hydrothermalis (strain DSM 14884 / JCM 11576 / T1) TaxID=869210 RepID=F2NPZ4_MARHT|nr:UDP-3-O-acyl-N-acetylglucosamine deacetylase [Marinithermus hydrothermalis]AEB11095.1 UDP-3-0-acyl N-acetylglucosamine deacetylase [Marinithermus hydrothermalis DSM 14884]
MTVEGVGLHTGAPARVRFHLEEGPVRFRVGRVEIPARASRVVETTRATVLGGEGVRLATVEHLLAALFLRGIWTGLVIEVEGPELPILDGSAAEWLAVLEGLTPAPLPAARVPERIRVGDASSTVMAEPAEGFSVTVSIFFKHPRIGYQSFESPPRALREVADARTFGFAHEAEALRAQGLIQGASLRSVLVYGERAPLNPPRGVDEPVRHKALDFLGDLYLAGRPPLGRFVVHRGAHRWHVELARRLEAVWQS